MARRTCYIVFVAPVFLWGYDFVLHLLEPFLLNRILWFALLNLGMPTIAYIAIFQCYRGLTEYKRHITFLSPEVPAALLFLYTQPIYMFVVSTYLWNKPLLMGDLTWWLKLTIAVPVSNLYISFYDGSIVGLIAVCISMFMAGHNARRRKVNK